MRSVEEYVIRTLGLIALSAFFTAFHGCGEKPQKGAESSREESVESKLDAVDSLKKAQGEDDPTLLIGELKHSDPEVREAAARALGERKEPSAITALSFMIRNDFPTPRRAAIEALGLIGDLESASILVEAMTKYGPDDRERALTALAALGPGALPELVKAGRSEAAAQAIEKIGAPAVEPLLKELNESGEKPNLLVVEALGRIGDGRALDPLILLLKNPRIDVRRNAVTALGRIGDPRAIEQLAALLGEKDRGVEGDAIVALALIGGENAVATLISHLEDSHLERRRRGPDGRIREALILAGPSVAPFLTEAVNSKSLAVRGMAASVLGSIGPTAEQVTLFIDLLADKEKKHLAQKVLAGGDISVEPLIGALAEREPAVAIGAAETLGEIGDRRAVEPLIAALGVDHLGIVRASIRALGRIGDPRGVDPISKYITHTDVRREAFSGLRAIGTPSVDVFLKILSSGSDDDKYPAIEALGEIADRRAVGPLLELLEHSRFDEAAAIALVKIKAPEAFEPLIESLKREPELRRSLNNMDRNWKQTETARRYVADAVTLMERGEADSAARRGAARLIRAANADSKWVPNLVTIFEKEKEDAIAADVLYAITDSGGEGAVGVLIAGLERDAVNRRGGSDFLSSRTVRTAAIYLLSESKSPEAVEPLVALLDRDMTSYEKEATIMALGKIGDPRAVNRLMEMVKNSPILAYRRKACWALGKIGDPRAIPTLKEKVDNRDKDFQVYSYAKEALAEIRKKNYKK